MTASALIFTLPILRSGTCCSGVPQAWVHLPRDAKWAASFRTFLEFHAISHNTSDVYLITRLPVKLKATPGT